MTSLTEFPLFSDLPSELRLKIWGMTIHNPRVVHISCQKAINKLRREPTRYVEAFFSITPPAAINVCHESRFEALATYKKYFQTEHSPNYVYLALDQDTIRCSDNILEHFGPVEKRGIERLILDIADAGYFGHFNMSIIKDMVCLKELELYTDEGDLESWRGGNERILHGDFDRERHHDPGWVCPLVRIINRDTGKDMGVIASAALIPGWKAGDHNPLLD
ncbi:uncharacterized protein L3040_000666 [Drepanopeziza brunnea f. sp. 'multigermtubi']|uniref:uncharacterized protein n=1 Tax=Drepanopeziza brunnea f. sp. 'multigermtubi' TaxID=698441 RepID=UPI0023A0C171|nr:hypothetical protein L3040_000666 [Drepanopeziza brunnea f. sp. 'multigermtubi']